MFGTHRNFRDRANISAVISEFAVRAISTTTERVRSALADLEDKEGSTAYSRLCEARWQAKGQPRGGVLTPVKRSQGTDSECVEDSLNQRIRGHARK